MGNCIGGVSHNYMPESPGRVDNRADEHREISADEFIATRHQLADTAYLTTEQHNFVSNHAPPTIRDRYNTLFQVTSQLLATANAHHAHMTGTSSIATGMRTADLMEHLQERLEPWDDMRDIVDHAMNAQSEPLAEPVHAAEFIATRNPSGSMRIYRETPRDNRD